MAIGDQMRQVIISINVSGKSPAWVEMKRSPSVSVKLDTMEFSVTTVIQAGVGQELQTAPHVQI